MQFYLSNICRNRITESEENYASKLPVNMTTVPNFLDLTLMLFFVQLLSGKFIVNCRAL